jgi:type VI secretion system secreted protein Hcp
MAIETHIKFDGVEGESTHADHKGEIELLAWA